MVCVAAFIILLVIWLFTPALRLFGLKKQANAISSMFKKSMHCFSRRATFRACDSNFKDEIKDSVLSKLIVRHKKWVKPVSVGIEVVSFLIVVITIWSLLTVAKAGLALYVYGTCDVRTPNACVLGSSEACSIDTVGSGNMVVDWFAEWGEVFGALPARLRTWDAQEFVADNYSYYGEFTSESQPTEYAVDFFDPGCIICRQSFIAQKDSGFFDNYKTYLMPYAIREENGYKFRNSDLIARYIEALRSQQPENGDQISAEWMIIENLFTREDGEGNVYQDKFNGTAPRPYSESQATEKLHEWLAEVGFSETQIVEIAEFSQSDEVAQRLDQARDIIENQVMTKRIPTMIYDGKKHEGLFK